MSLKSTAIGLLVSPDSPTGSVKLYAALDWQRLVVDSTTYVGTAANSTGALGRILAVNTSKALVQIQLLKPVTHSGNVLPSYTGWAEAKLLSEYSPKTTDDSALKFYYCTGNGVRLRSTASIASLTNVVGKANRGALLGKSDGYVNNGFILLYAVTLSGSFILDKSGKRTAYYVHKDYVTTVNPAAAKPADNTAPVDTNAPSEGNGKPTVSLDEPTAGANSLLIIGSVILGMLALGVGVINYVRNRAKPKKKP